MVQEKKKNVSNKQYMNDINICFLINNLYLDLTYKAIDHIKKRFKSKDHRLRFLLVGTEELKNKRDDCEYYVSEHTDLPILHQRVWLPHLLGVDKFIFIDSDTITLTCISRLWDIDMKGKTVAASQHCACGWWDILTINWSEMNFSPFRDYPENKYFNCGVMIYDCKKWIDNNIAEQCIDAFKLYAHTRYRGYDEPGYNLVLKDDWFELNKKWNYLPIPKAPIQSCHILHYYGEYPAGTPRHNMF